MLWRLLPRRAMVRVNPEARFEILVVECGRLKEMISGQTRRCSKQHF